MLKYKIMFQIFFVPKYFWVLEAVIFGTLLPDHPVLSSVTPSVCHKVKPLNQRGLAAQSKCHIGISPSGQKMGHWDLSQSHVQDVSGIDPNVKKRGFWDQSQCLVQVVSGIAPN